MLRVGTTSDWPSIALSLAGVEFPANESNGAVLDLGPGLSSPSMPMEAWNWLLDCRFSNNRGGTLLRLAADDRYLHLRGTDFLDNDCAELLVHDSGGLSDAAQLVVQNGLFVSNAGSIAARGRGHLLLQNCTLHGNACDITAGGSATASLHTAILWAHGGALAEEAAGRLDVQYSATGLPAPHPGPGHLTNDPHFADAAGRDFHLHRLSPCLDAGDPATEHRNEPEPNGGQVNLGRYGNTREAACWRDWMGPSIACTGLTVVLEFPTHSGSWYRAESAPWPSGPWTEIDDRQADADGVRLTAPAAGDRGFFRVYHYRP